MPDILTDTPATARPLLSATSDMPTLEPATPEPTSEPAEPTTLAPEPESSAQVDAEPSEPLAEPKPSKPKDGIGERISTYAERARAAEARAERLEKIVEQIIERVPQPQQTQPVQTTAPTPEPPAPRPRRENFSDPDAYDAAVDEWSEARSQRMIDIKLAEREHVAKAEREKTERETQQQAAERQLTEIDRTYRERVASVAEKYPDYAEVVEAPDLPFRGVIADAIRVSEHGPEIAYHLATHREELNKLAAMPPVQQALYLGRMEASLTAPRAQAPSAPAPITPLRRGTNTAAPTTLQDAMERGGIEEYAAMRQKQLGTRYGSQGIGRVS